AVLLRHLNAHQSQRSQRGDDFRGEMLRFVPFTNVRTNFGFRELANASAEQFLIFGQAKVHQTSVPLRGVRDARGSGLGIRGSGLGPRGAGLTVMGRTLINSPCTRSPLRMTSVSALSETPNTRNSRPAQPHACDGFTSRSPGRRFVLLSTSEPARRRSRR